ncbi:MAG: sulfotransferase domain-containing protein [Cyanobacteria bacterium P01_G01_bin.67]
MNQALQPSYMKKTTLRSRLRAIAKYPIPLTINELNAANNGQKVLINSLPKSGTFLLRRALSILPNFAPRWSIHGLDAGEPNLNRKIQNIRRGQFASGHLYWSEELTDLLVTNNIRTIFIIRDLRDVAVSLAFYLANKKSNHHLYDYFASLESNDDRLMEVILGAKQQLFSDCPTPKSLGEFGMAFFPWLKEPNCLAVRFEDLIGSAGGGDDQKQIESFREIINYLELDISAEKTAQLSQKLFFQNSHTFRKGKIGDWQNWFTAEHKRVFKEFAGKALIEFGYEDDDDW